MIHRRGIILCLVGPAGSGKTSHGDHLLKDFSKSLSHSISVTTRQARADEKDGIHYHFISKKDFERKAAAGEFFEWEEVHGNLYGTLKSTVTESTASGRDLLLRIDIRGALKFKKQYTGDTVIIFLVPPTADALQTRMQGRGSISDSELKRRLDTAKEEYTALIKSIDGQEQVDYFIVNDVREDAYASVRAVYLAEQRRFGRQAIDEVKKLCKV